MGKEVQVLNFLCPTKKVEIVKGPLDTFIIEPFLPHAQSDEYYISINSVREGDE